MAVTIAFAVLPAARAQEAAPGSPALSSPLADYTLRYLIPVRPIEEIEAEREFAGLWRRGAERLAERATEAETVAKQKIEIKKAEIKTLDLRRKTAKKQKEAGREVEIRAAIEAEKSQLETLGLVRELAKGEQELAKDWAEAAIALDLSSRAQLELAKYRESQRAVIEAAKVAGQSAPERDPRGWDLNEQFLATTRDFGVRLEKFGNTTKSVLRDRSKLLEAWRQHNLD